MTPPKRLVIVGDPACGKTLLACQIHKRQFPQEYIAAWRHQLITTVDVDGRSVKLAIRDISGYASDDSRQAEYAEASLILICFAIDQPESLERITQKWIPEILYHRSVPPIPYILVGCKKDLRRKSDVRDGKGIPLVSFEDAQAMARRIGAVDYVECTAINDDGVLDLLRLVAKTSKSSVLQGGDGKCIIF